MHLVYSLPKEKLEDESMWLHEHLPELNPTRCWHPSYSNVSNKYVFTVILKKGQEHITKMILERHGEAKFGMVRPKPTGLVTCFPNH